MFAVVPLKSGDGGKDDNASAQTRSKSKSKKSSKKSKSSKKGHSSSEPSPKKAKGAVTGDKVSSPFFFNVSFIWQHLDSNSTCSYSLAFRLKLTK